MGVIRLRGQPLPQGAIEALVRGRIHEAIRAVCAAESIGFREAKRLVEQHIVADPELCRTWQLRRDASLAALRRLVRLVAVLSGAALGWLIVV